MRKVLALVVIAALVAGWLARSRRDAAAGPGTKVGETARVEVPSRDIAPAGTPDPEPGPRSDARGRQAVSLPVGAARSVERRVVELTIEGRVVDERGEPVPAFEVEPGFHEGGGRFFLPPVAGSEGRFVLEGLRAGEWSLHATAEGYLETQKELTLPTPEPIVLQLTRGAEVNGVVLDALGRPAPFATVFVVKDGEDSPTLAFDDGTFHLSELAPGTRRLYARKHALGISPKQTVVVEAGHPVEGIVLRLEAPAALRGRVLGLDGGPAASVEVMIRTESELELHTTDPRGEFAVDDLAPGSAHVQASVQGLELGREITLVSGEITDIVLQLEGTAPVLLHGRVTLGGVPAAEGWILVHPRARASRENGTSASAIVADGAYELTLPGPGSYALVYQDSGLRHETRLEVPAVQEHTHLLALVLGRVRGRVSAPDGAPLGRVKVVSRLEPDGSLLDGGSASTDDDGRYELRLPPGRHELRAGGPDGYLQGAAHAEAVRPGIEVRTDGLVEGIDFVLEPGGVVEVVLLGTDGAPDAGAICYSLEEGSPRWLFIVNTGGVLRLAGLTPGTLFLGAASTTGATARAVAVRVGLDERVELRLVSARPVRLSVRDADGAPVTAEVQVRSADGQLRPLFPPDFPGEVDVAPLPPGRYSVVAVGSAGRARRELVVDGGSGTLEFELVLE